VNAIPPRSPLHFTEALRFWLKLGCISFGGPAGQIAIMHKELVEERHWISEHRFLHALNYCMLLPGPEAQQLATYIGWLLHGTRGGIAAGALFVLPSLVLLAALSWAYVTWGQHTIVTSIFYGIKPAVVAIVLFAAYRVGSRTLRHPLLWSLAIVALLTSHLGVISFPWMVAGAAILGIIVGQWRPAWFATPEHSHHKTSKPTTPALIDDHAEPAYHMRWRPQRALCYSLAGVGLGAGLLITLVTLFGWQSLYSQMGWFFTKAALLTFGGAYAVLPYVHDAAVNHYHWVSAPQMMDGLALGETTPGPLIMIVAFVGFVGGWQSTFCTNAMLSCSVGAASIATFFTFLPSFLFILVGAPLVEATRHRPRFTAPLTAISAAVVGVIFSLALFFAKHALWHPITAHLDMGALAISVLAFIALYRFKINVVWVIAGSGLAGYIIAALG
jgi:chromate transporter